MQSIRYALACAALAVPAVSNAQVAAAPAKTAQLSKIIFNPDTAKANQRIKVGTICLFAGDPFNFGSAERSVNLERFERLFSTAMADRGFKVVAKSTNLFESEDKSDTDFLVGATFRVDSIDVCDSVNGLKGKLTISVEWQLYDRARKEVVETVTTQGSAQLPKFAQNGLMLMIDEAFTASLTSLIDQGVLQKQLGNPTP